MRPEPRPAKIGGYIPPQLLASTLDQLADRCGQYGPAARQDAQWSAAIVWLMNAPPGAPYASAVASLSLNLCQMEDRVNLGYPSLSGKPFYSRLPNLSAESRAEAIRTAAETMAQWVEAGRPYLHRIIQRRHKYIHACLQAEKKEKLAA